MNDDNLLREARPSAQLLLLLHLYLLTLCCMIFGSGTNLILLLILLLLLFLLFFLLGQSLQKRLRLRRLLLDRDEIWQIVL